jgi:hypothetical protein
MPNPKLFILGEPDDFTKQEFNYLADLITEKLHDKGIEPEGYAFQIRVEYNEDN